MSVENLTQIQKNYVLMLLMGGDLPENEIRMFLARSGWSIDQIDAGVIYSKDEGLRRTLAEAISPQNTTLETQVSDPESTKDVFTINEIDPYRETAEAVAQDFSDISQIGLSKTAMSTKPTLKDISIKNNQPINNISQVVSSNSTNALIMTMPAVQPSSHATAILSALAWLLFVTLIMLCSGVIGYMYYTGTGIFGDVIYTKLNLNA